MPCFWVLAKFYSNKRYALKDGFHLWERLEFKTNYKNKERYLMYTLNLHKATNIWEEYPDRGILFET